MQYFLRHLISIPKEMTRFSCHNFQKCQTFVVLLPRAESYRALFSLTLFCLCKYNTILMNLKWVSKNWDKFISSQKKMNVNINFHFNWNITKVGIALKDLMYKFVIQENNHIKWLKRIDQPNQVDNSSVFISFVLVSCFENTVLNDSCCC
jgi:hypothetical protein